MPDLEILIQIWRKKDRFQLFIRLERLMSTPRVTVLLLL
jgi:hypothetical protein